MFQLFQSSAFGCRPRTVWPRPKASDAASLALETEAWSSSPKLPGDSKMTGDSKLTPPPPPPSWMQGSRALPPPPPHQRGSRCPHWVDQPRALPPERQEGGARASRCRPPCGVAQIFHEKRIRLKLSGNEVYCTNAVTLLVKEMLCSKLHYQKGFNLILFSYEVSSHTMHSLNGFRKSPPPTKSQLIVLIRNSIHQLDDFSGSCLSETIEFIHSVR